MIFEWFGVWTSLLMTSRNQTFFWVPTEDELFNFLKCKDPPDGNQNGTQKVIETEDFFQGDRGFMSFV